MLFWKFNLGLYDLSGTDQKLLPILSKGRPGPPEIIGGHEPTGYYALGIKNHEKSKALIFPVNLGKIYYMHGYQEHKNLLLDAISYVLPEANQDIQTNAPERIEVILKEFVKNNVSNKEKVKIDGLILHLVNLTGFSGNTYFGPLPVYNLDFKIKSIKKPRKVFSLSSGQPIKFTHNNAFINLEVNKLEGFDGIVMEY